LENKSSKRHELAEKGNRVLIQILIFKLENSLTIKSVIKTINDCNGLRKVWVSHPFSSIIHPYF